MTGITITNHILEQQYAHAGATGAFTHLLNEIVMAAKIINSEVNKAGLVDILGSTGRRNVQGETVKKLDEFSNRLMVDRLYRSGHVAMLASEEDPDPIEPPRDCKTGEYIVLFDPLDGSSNIDANVSIGTIFSILKRRTSGLECDMNDFLQPGTQQVAAGYVLYGSSTMLVYSTGNGVSGFTLDPSVGEFLLSHPDIQIPARGKIVSANMGYWDYWDPDQVAKLLPLSAHQDRGQAGLLFALHRLHGGRHPPHSALWRGVPLSGRLQGPQEALGQAAPALRVQPHGLPNRAGRRRGLHRPGPGAGGGARASCTSGCPLSRAAPRTWPRPWPLSVASAANNQDPGRLVLGIESSCDESAAALVEDGRRVLSSVVASQVKDHAPFGGVVPELASRRHLENLAPVVTRRPGRGRRHPGRHHRHGGHPGAGAHRRPAGGP